MRRFPRPATLVATLLAGGALIAGCGGGSKLVVVNHQVTVSAPAPGSPAPTVEGLGLPILATNNTTRVTGTSAIEDAAGVARRSIRHTRRGRIRRQCRSRPPT